MELCCNERVVEERGSRVRQADVDAANRSILDRTGIRQWTELRMVLEELERGEAIQTVQREISQTMEVSVTDEGRRMSEALKHGEEILSEACRIGKYRRKYDRIGLKVRLIEDGTKKLQLSVEAGNGIWLIGRNGSGKTTLVNRIAEHWKEAASEAPMIVEASRSTKMQGMGGISQTGLEVSTGRRGEPAVVRISGEQEELGQLLHEVERQQKARQERMLVYGRAGLDAEAGACLREQETALEATNRVLKRAGLHYVVARNGDGHYGVEGPSAREIGTLSDGERAALQMALAVLNQADGTLIALDEPDKHLSADTARDLISALREERKNSCFVMATHSDVEWDIREGDQVYEVRGVDWRGGTATWDVEKTSREAGMGKLAGVIRRDQRPTVLVEGTEESLDRAMYEALLLNWRVIPRESRTKVEGEVKRINETADVHGCEVRGIVDGDGRLDAGTWVGDKQETWVLPMNSIENVYWSQTALSPVIEALAKLRGEKPETLLTKAQAALCVAEGGVAAMWEKLETDRLKGGGSETRAKVAKALGRPIKEIEALVLAEVRRSRRVQERLRQKTGLASWVEIGRAQDEEIELVAPQNGHRGAQKQNETRGTMHQIPRVLYQWIPSPTNDLESVQIGISSPHGYRYTQTITRRQREIYVTIPTDLIGEEVTVWAEAAGRAGERVEITKPYAIGVDERKIGAGGVVIFEWGIHEIEG